MLNCSVLHKSPLLAGSFGCIVLEEHNKAVCIRLLRGMWMGEYLNCILVVARDAISEITRIMKTQNNYYSVLKVIREHLRSCQRSSVEKVLPYAWDTHILV